MFRYLFEDSCRIMILIKKFITRGVKTIKYNLFSNESKRQTQ